MKKTATYPFAWTRKLAGRLIAEPYILVLGVLVAITLFLVVVPLGLLLLSSFSGARPGVIENLSLAGYARAYLDPKTYHLFQNTFLYAAGATFFGLFFGTTFAWAVERTNMPFKTVAYATIPLTIVIPGALSSIAWIFLLSPKIGYINKFLVSLLNLAESPFNIYTLPGMCFVQGLSFTGTVFLMVVPAFQGLDPALEEASATSGVSTFGTMRRITLKLMLPALISAAIYVGMVGISVFEIPAMIGMPKRISVFSTKLYMATHGWSRDFAMAGALSMTILLFSFAGIYVYNRMTRQTAKYATITGKGYRPRTIDLGMGKYMALALFATYLTVAIILPILTLIWISLIPYAMAPSREAFSMISLDSYREVLSYQALRQAIKNTIIMMFTAATVTMILSSMISWIVVRSHVRGRRILDFLAFVPHGIPGIVMGLALIWVYLTFKFIPIYGTVWIISVAFITRYLSFGTRTTNAAMLQLHRELEEAAQTSGASWGRTFMRIIIPLLTPAFINGWLFVAVHSMRDLSAPVMLGTGKNVVIAVVIWDLWTNGRVTQSAAVGVMLLIIIAMIMLAARVLGYRIGRKL
ncbi:MAG: iron ABC transporter permease [Desulfobacterales bacterium]|nr:iron ABC transporter permease [Desulfobacterales bacterium]